jgi:hypothetical protein
MTVRSGSHLPTSGLVCVIDPNSVKGYPGSGTVLYDSTGNGNNVTGVSSGEFVTYNSLRVLRLDNTQYRTVSTLSVTLPYTILGVDRYNGLGANAKGRTISSSTTNWLMNHHGGNRYTYYAGGWMTNNAADPGNAWTIGIVTGATGDYHCYFDNIDKTVAPAAGTVATGTIQINGWSAGANEISNMDLGMIAVWNRVLTAAEISQVYSSMKLRFEQ